MVKEAGNVQFVPFCSFIDPAFWYSLSKLKLESLQLDESPFPAWGFFANSGAEGVPCRLTIDFNALNLDKCPSSNTFVSHGTVHVVNTLEKFKEADKKALIDSVGKRIFLDIVSGRAFGDSSLLSRFYLITYVDIKRYHFYYWLACPALCYPTNIRYLYSPHRLPDLFHAEQINSLQRICSNISREDASGYFLLEEVHPGGYFQVLDFSNVKATDIPDDKLLIGFCDPSNQRDCPGWPLRNLLALWAIHRPNSRSARVLCWRFRYENNRVDCSHSLILDIAYDKPEGSGSGDPEAVLLGEVKTVGWERDKAGRFCSQFVDLSSGMDPKKLSEEAVRLNLHLMRWRLVPDLNLDIVRDSSCLLFGAGTLGCNVARLLSAWGCSKITFIDNARVSYSNPARQSLYLNEDCATRKLKCDAAVAAIQAICPNINVAGYNITVPSPGHPVDQKEMPELLNAIHQLDELVQSHEAIFLLLDTREARWLPALFGCYHKKIVITVALGFDNYLVLRHGLGPRRNSCTGNKPYNGNKSISGCDLACYFCCDITAPGDSTKGRTIDQQCSVTRPGLSAIAAGNAVELYISVLQHPLKAAAPTMAADNEGSTCLGTIPHQIRGYLNRFEQNVHSVERYSACIACSSGVIGEFETNKANFIIQVLNTPTFLEEITGLDKLKSTVDYGALLEISDAEEAAESDDEYVLAHTDVGQNIQ